MKKYIFGVTFLDDGSNYYTDITNIAAGINNLSNSILRKKD